MAGRQTLLTSDLISGHKQSKNFEPYRTSGWTIYIEGLNGAEDLALAVATGQDPVVTNDPHQLGLGNDNIKVAGQANVEPMQIAVRDFVSPHILAILIAWRKLVYDPLTGIQGFASDYKKIGTLLYWSVKGSHHRSYTLDGIWPLNSPSAQLDHNSSEPRVLDIQLSIDRVVPEGDMLQTAAGPTLPNQNPGLFR